MGKDTNISWATHTFNPWWGCTKVSPGCANCYAEAFDKRVGGKHWGVGAPRRTFLDSHWAEPIGWNAAAKPGDGTTVFCASMADVMDDAAPLGERWRLWELIDRTPNLTWLLLTKRPENFCEYLPSDGFAYDNVRLGATTENQHYYDERIGPLTGAALWLTIQNSERDRHVDRRTVRTFVSYEPALGPVTMRDRKAPDQVIFGGETGGKRRAPSVEWARSMRHECERRGVAFFMKQMSAQTPAGAAALIPADLLIQQTITTKE